MHPLPPPYLTLHSRSVLPLLLIPAENFHLIFNLLSINRTNNKKEMKKRKRDPNTNIKIDKSSKQLTVKTSLQDAIEKHDFVKTLFPEKSNYVMCAHE